MRVIYITRKSALFPNNGWEIPVKWPQNSLSDNAWQLTHRNILHPRWVMLPNLVNLHQIAQINIKKGESGPAGAHPKNCGSLQIPKTFCLHWVGYHAKFYGSMSTSDPDGLRRCTRFTQLFSAFDVWWLSKFDANLSTNFWSYSVRIRTNWHK